MTVTYYLFGWVLLPIMPLLGYWDVRAIGQQIRLLLHYVGEEYEEKLYSVGPPPEFSRESWLNEKFTLGLDFPNLPYYMDGDVKLSQSNAIMRYIGRKHNLCGKTEQEKIRVDLVENQNYDFRSGFYMVCYSPNFESLKLDYLEKLPAKLEQFENFIGERAYFASDEITVVDFSMYEILDQHRNFVPSCLEKFPKLQAFMDRIEALPRIKAYMSSDKFIRWPISGDMASWGAKSQK